MFVLLSNNPVLHGNGDFAENELNTNSAATKVAPVLVKVSIIVNQIFLLDAFCTRF